MEIISYVTSFYKVTGIYIFTAAFTDIFFSSSIDHNRI